MGKSKAQSVSKKQQKRKQKQIDKQRMEKVMQELAANKQKNKKITVGLKSITSIHRNHQEMKKAKKNAERKKSREEWPMEEEQIQQENNQEKTQQACKIQQKPVINIFAVDQFVAQQPVIIKQPSNKMDEQLDLQSRARKVMGENLNTDRFGDKPFKVIQEKNEDAMDQEADDNKQKQGVITHPNIKVPAGNVKVKRSKAIQEFREKLPIYMKQQQIVETVNNNLVTLICGETGSGKSTQLPQFLFEKNYQSLGKIGITQPRRLATTSLAQRVAEQMHFKIGSQIGFQVRHERRQSQKTLIKFMTDGILLKEMSSDPMLLDYSVVIIDEAHQRKINTDILIGLLSRLILVRYKNSLQGKCQPLRLVIMSATLRAEDFKNKTLFDFHIPTLKVDSKMFPVTIFHEKRTPDDYIESAIKKCIKIHKQLPPGDVLVFLTGKQQIHQAFIKLQQQLERLNFQIEQYQDDSDQIRVEGENIADEGPRSQFHNYIIYKLYSSLPTDQQKRIFEVPPQGCRKFILSTNIAETSITVPNIRYVIDCGQEKHRYFDGVWRWSKGWGSKAMATQRAGRAGRTTHGYCYRLYSSALYANIMAEHPDPEINKQPLESILLQIKAIGFNDVYAFPFPSQPERKSILKGLDILKKTQSIVGQFSYQSDETKITQLGRIISFIPLAPRLAKMLLMGRKQHIQKHTLLLCILLTVQEIYAVKSSSYSESYEQHELKSEKKLQHNQFVKNYGKYIQKQAWGDVFTAINVAGQFMVSIITKFNSKSNEKKGRNNTIMQIIKDESIRFKLNQNVMRQFYYNCDQISEIYETLTSNKIDLAVYQRPKGSQITVMLQILLANFVENTCKFQQNNLYKNKDRESIFIHRLSPLYKAKHLFVSCTDFFTNLGTRKYMKFPFVVINYELLASYGEKKKPYGYAWKNDQIVGLVNGVLYGWQIPNLIVKDPEGELKYYEIAKMLLAGSIFEGFKILGDKNMLNASVSIIKPDNLQEKVQSLVYAFKIRKITTKQQLIETMKTDEHFLEKQLLSWLNAKNPQKVYKILRQSVIKS